jgi:catechol 2,3-dioxygenase-like lactoylglutathione lyase family enzyme
MLNVPTFIGTAFDQICFVVDDLDVAVDYWRRVHGVEKWAIAYDLAKWQTHKEYWGEPEDFQFSCAYGFAGDTLIELARHDGGRSVYKDWLDERGTGPHHIGFRVADMADYEAAEQHYLANGIVKAMTGWFKADTGGCLWSYWDTRASLGCYTELYVLDGLALEQFHLYKAGLVDSLIPG